MKRKSLSLVICLFLVQGLSAQVVDEQPIFYSSSLEQDRLVVISIPEACTDTSPCPVLIWLPGCPSTAGFASPEIMADLINAGQIDPMIIASPEAFGGVHQCHWWWNSSVNGNFGNYVVQDLVEWIKQEYNVMEGPQGEHLRRYWLIGGFSMGGECGRLALVHHDIFSGFAAFSGLLQMKRWKDWFDWLGEYENPDAIYTPPEQGQFYTYNVWSAASAFSPDPNSPYFAQFPLKEGSGSVIDSVFNKWLAVNPVTLANDYFNVKGNPASSMSIHIRVGENEPFVSVVEFSEDFSDSLNAWGIDHDFATHPGGHGYDRAMVEDVLIWADNHFKSQPTAVNAREKNVLQTFRLEQNYPNPFNPETTIRYTLLKTVHVELAVFSVTGQRVETLFVGRQAAGNHNYVWDASQLSSGIYFYRLTAGDFVGSRKMILLQ